MAVTDQELAGLDALAVETATRTTPLRRIWSASWPKLAAIALGIGAWQAAVSSGWRPDYLLPPPGPVFTRLRADIQTGDFWEALGRTGQRALLGYALAIVIGGLIGLVVARVKIVRVAVGSLITGLQTMPSIAWFPLAILLFQLTEKAIFFVVVMGAAPSIASGIVAGIDHVPPVLLRAGKVLGARGVALFRHVIIPAALPSVVSGLKQGWAFAWRSLMAGELLVIVPGHPSVGSRLQLARDFADAEGLLAQMIVILVVGIVVDAVFTTADRTLRQRRGLVDTAA